MTRPTAAQRPIAVLILTAIVAGCGTAGQSGPSRPPDASSTLPTAAATMEPSPTLERSTAEPSFGAAPPTNEPAQGSWSTDPSHPLLIGTAIRPIVDRVNVRDRPWLEAELVGAVTPDEVLEVLGPPFRGDGYIWHHVVVRSATGRLPNLPRHLGGAGEPMFGWVAVRTAGGDATYVEALGPRCPTTIDVAYVSSMLAAERLACFRSDTIDIEGVWEGCYCNWPHPGIFNPGWLADTNSGGRLARDPNEGINGVWLQFPLDGPDEPEKGAIVRATIHFDDARATTCEISLPFDWEWDAPGAVSHPIGAVSSERICRQRAVVDDYDVIGTYAGEWPDID